MNAPLQVYLGHDPREVDAYDVACHSITSRSSAPISINPLKLDVLRAAGLYWRQTTRYAPGSLWDCLSKAKMSTEFAISRFLVPILQPTGWALFCDCDIVCLGDVAELFALADPKYAVMCVQHAPQLEEGVKMDGQAQQPYPRKGWSSITLWNCDHESNKRLDLKMVNTWPGALLHRFSWLRDSEIGALPAEWNWLVGVEPKPVDPKIAHFTLGGPWLEDWQHANHDEIWMEEQTLMLTPKSRRVRALRP